MKCLTCQSENLDTQNFCGHCGSRLSFAGDSPGIALTPYTPAHLSERILKTRSALEGERKLVTIMFCDIVDSTELAAKLGVDATHTLLNRFFELALSEVHRFAGTINQFLGDGFMALFGAPLAHEDHARRGLLAALAVQQRLTESSFRDSFTRDVRIRTGINTGLVVVGTVGDNLRMDYTAIGDSTHLASRLQQLAEPDTVVVSESTYRAARSFFDFRPLGKRQPKGIDSPIEIYEVLRVRSAKALQPRLGAAEVGSALVGRNSELKIVTHALDRLGNGQGGIVIIQAEAGVGKSRLITEARQRTTMRQIQWLEGRSLSFGSAVSYLPLREILRQYFDIAEVDSDTNTWRKLESRCKELFGTRADEITPYVGTVLGIAMIPKFEHRVNYLDSQALRRQIFLSMREFLVQIATRQPVLILMEDWHWVDHSSIELLEHLLPLASKHPIGFWFATRPEPTGPVGRIRAVTSISTEASPMQQITLPALDERESATLLDNLLPTNAIPPAMRAQILSKTDGNPFFMEEVMRALISDGSLTKDANGLAWNLTKTIGSVSVPDTLQGVITARIDRLEEDVKSVVKLASVIGRRFFLRILRPVGESNHSMDQELTQLEHAELIHLSQPIPETEYIFNHALVQEAAYASIVADRRKATHRNVAKAIENLFANRIEEFVSVLAFHYARAEAWDKAQEYLFKAGDHAGRMAADFEALQHYQQAELAYMKAVGQDLSPLKRATLNRKLGQAFYGVGDHEQAVEHFSRALSDLGLRLPKTRAGIRMGILRFLGGHFAGRALKCLGLPFRRRMDMAKGQEIASTCRALAWIDFFGDEERMVLDAMMELYVGDRSGDMLARARGLSTLGLILVLYQSFGLARKILGEAMAMAEASKHPSAIGEVFLTLGWLELAVGSLDQSELFFEKSANAYRAAGDIMRWGGPTGYLVWVSFLKACPDQAMTHVQSLISIAQSSGEKHIYSWGLNQKSAIALIYGTLDESEESISQALSVAKALSSVRIVAMLKGFLGKCLLRKGRLNEAQAVLQESLGSIRAHGLRGFQCADPLTGYAELCLIQAEHASGDSRRQFITRSSRACTAEIKCARGAQTWMPEALRLHGTLAWLSGNQEIARARWQESLDVAERIGIPLERGRTLLEMGRRIGELMHVREALTIFSSIGSQVYAAMAQHSLADIAVQSRMDIHELLSHFDASIDALEAVNAQYDLGVAYSSRADLLAKRGQVAETLHDLDRAQLCFQMTGAHAAAEAAKVRATSLQEVASKHG